MTLDELNKLAAKDDVRACCDGEVVEEETQTLEEDLGEALDLLEQLLDMVENIRVRRQRVVRVPEGMTELLEECRDFLDQWPSGDDALKDAD